MPKQKKPKNHVRPEPYPGKDADETPRTKALRKNLEEHLCDHPEWKGNGEDDAEYSIEGRPFRSTKNSKPVMKAAGEKYGCHTCNQKIVNDADQPWTGDHIPSTNLAPKVKDILFPDWDGTTHLIAQCDACSARQSALVKALNTQDDPDAYFQTLSPPEKKMILGGRKGTIVSRSADSTTHAGDLIQLEGAKLGCHSCKAKFPSSIYHADHLPPKELNTSYVRAVVKALDMEIEVFDHPILLPQCSRCSHRQGTDVQQVALEAEAYAREKLKIPVYKS